MIKSPFVSFWILFIVVIVFIIIFPETLWLLSWEIILRFVGVIGLITLSVIQGLIWLVLVEIVWGALLLLVTIVNLLISWFLPILFHLLDLGDIC